jgi:hypothetical protein
MSDQTDALGVKSGPGPSSPLRLRLLHGEVRTPPFTPNAWIETRFLLRRLQDGESLGMPHPRPVPSIGARCHELRLLDEQPVATVLRRRSAGPMIKLGAAALLHSKELAASGGNAAMRQASRSVARLPAA